MTGTGPPGPPPNPRRGRQRNLIRFLRAALALVAVAALAAVLLPERWGGRIAGWAVVALLVGVPAVRIAWLDVRWFRLGDRRFAAVATAVLGVVAAGALLAALV